MEPTFNRYPPARGSVRNPPIHLGTHRMKNKKLLSQTSKTTYSTIPWLWHSGKGKTAGVENRSGFAEGFFWGQGLLSRSTMKAFLEVLELFLIVVDAWLMPLWKHMGLDTTGERIVLCVNLKIEKETASNSATMYDRMGLLHGKWIHF